MPQIALKLNKDIFVPKFFPYLTDYSHRFECYMGSAGSAKSYFITQKLIYRACSQRIRILVCRRTAATIRNTCFSLFKDVLSKWRLTPYVKIRETNFSIAFPNGSEIIFLGLDEETKLLSLNNIGSIFIEEAFEVPKSTFEQLNLRMRAQIENPQIIMAWNPLSKNHWLYDFCLNPPQSFIMIHSTFRDNPFLPQAYIDTLNELYVRNPAKARIFCDGEWGVNTDGLVFTNWREEKFDIAQNWEVRIGIDFGFVDATAIVVSLFDSKAGAIYVYDEWYRTGAQLDDVADALAAMKIKKTIVYCDSAEPRSIEFLRKKGFNAKPCIKGQNSIKARIAFLQNNRITIAPKCVQCIRDFENFSYIKNRNDEWTEDTTHEYSHTIDALGYAYSDIYRANKLQTIEKSALGL